MIIILIIILITWFTTFILRIG